MKEADDPPAQGLTACSHVQYRFPDFQDFRFSISGCPIFDLRIYVQDFKIDFQMFNIELEFLNDDDNDVDENADNDDQGGRAPGSETACPDTVRFQNFMFVFAA